jgi:hypothetical protein
MIFPKSSEELNVKTIDSLKSNGLDSTMEILGSNETN